MPCFLFDPCWLFNLCLTRGVLAYKGVSTIINAACILTKGGCHFSYSYFFWLNIIVIAVIYDLPK